MRSTRSRFSTRNLSKYSLLAVVLVPAAVEAGERGGTESPFAFGVGARALSLGGAYVAAAEGPAALVWNPAGLSGEERKKLTFFYTSPFVEGNRYTFVGYVHPFLDLGTMGFGNVRYGISDIDKYDAGGAPLGSFDDLQNEWIFSYALPPFGPARFGANLKIETHSLDGHSATGVGADLGFLLQSTDPGRGSWSVRNLSLGIALRNAFEPRLSLSNDEERLPILVRSGLAYRVPLGGYPIDRLLFLFAWEQGRRSGGRTRLGAEMMLPHGLAMRVGTGPEEWSSGFGFALKGGHLDYSFGTQELGTAHRLELTVSFGSSLEMLRVDRQLREEELLAERTQEELLRREHAQIDASLLEGKAQLEKGAYAEAEAWFERALLWDSDNQTARELLAKARVEKHITEGDRHMHGGDLLEAIAEFSAAVAVDPGDQTASARLQKATELLNQTTARSREVSAHLTGGIEYLALADFLQAKRAFEAALQIEPENADVQRYLARTDSLIALRVDELVEEGSWYRGRGDVETAKEKYQEAIALLPDRDDLRREIGRIRSTPEPGQDRWREITLGQAEPKRRREVTPEEARAAERRYRIGVEEFSNRRHRESLRHFEFVYQLLPDHENVESYLKQAYLFLGMDHYTDGELGKAVEVWEKILDIDPENEKAISYIRRARIAIRKAKELSSEGR